MRLIWLVVAVAVGALVHATLALTKEGARARLTEPLQLRAAPGTTIAVSWTVTVPDGKGRREPFGACGMFVRLISRTGAPSSYGFARSRSCAAPFAAEVRVPTAGIGGIRMGLRGTTDIFFPLENDPFISPGGARCDVRALRATLTGFVQAFNSGDLLQLDRLFSRKRFRWYSSGAPGTRLSGAAARRSTLIAYFRERHRRGDRLILRKYRFNGYERAREVGHFAFWAERRAEDFRGGSWFALTGKGALDCEEPPVTITVMSIGSAR